MVVRPCPTRSQSRSGLGALLCLTVLVALSAYGEKSQNNASAASCNQSCQDNATGAATIGLLSFAYNQNLAGKAVGKQDLTANCPLGGTAHITGTNGYDSSTGIITMDLAFDLAACVAADSGYTLSFDGVVNQSGTLEQQGQISVAYSGSSFSFNGTIQGEAVSESGCNLALQEMRDSNDTNYRVNGLLCGRAVSY